MSVDVELVGCGNIVGEISKSDVKSILRTDLNQKPLQSRNADTAA